VPGGQSGQPQDDSLLAFYDRFLLRVPVQPVDDEYFTALLKTSASSEGDAPAHALIDPTRVAELRARATGVPLGEAAMALLLQARQHAAQSSQTVSDRRWRQLVALLQLQAASRDAAEVSGWDLWVLPYVLAADPAQVPGWIRFFLDTVAQTAPLPVEGLERAVMAFEKQLDTERRAPPDGQDDSAGKLALARAIARPGEESEMVRITSELALRRYSRVHIEARVAQCDALLERLMALHDEQLARAHGVLAQARAHAWLPPSWLVQIENVHAERCGHLAVLCAQHQSTRHGFADLPLDTNATGPLPERVQWTET
jgi:MoxR-like ATPase